MLNRGILSMNGKQTNNKNRGRLINCLILFVPLSLLCAGFATALYYQNILSGRTLLENNEMKHVNLQETLMIRDFESIVADLLILSEHHAFQKIFASADNSQGMVRALDELADTFLSVSKKKGLYDQIRFLDRGGKEILRVNYHSGDPVLVPERQLQL